MDYSISYSKPSVSVFIKTWLVEQLYYFKGKLYRRLVTNLVDDFDKITLIYLAKIKKADNLSVESAKYKLLALGETLKSFEKLDSLISEIKITPIANSFSALKKALYKYEAKLRKAAMRDAPIIETPHDIKLAVSNRTKKTLSLS